jgi:hypothetical protein
VGYGAAVKEWEIIADNLSRAGWSFGWVSAVDANGRTICIADAHRGDGRFIVHADEMLTAFTELESAIRGVSSCNQDESSLGCLGESQNDFLSGFFCCGNENGNHE